MTEIPAPVPAGPRGASCNGGPSVVTWLKGDWQTREAVLAQPSVHRP